MRVSRTTPPGAASNVRLNDSASASPSDDPPRAKVNAVAAKNRYARPLPISIAMCGDPALRVRAADEERAQDVPKAEGRQRDRHQPDRDHPARAVGDLAERAGVIGVPSGAERNADRQHADESVHDAIHREAGANRQSERPELTGLAPPLGCARAHVRRVSSIGTRKSRVVGRRCSAVGANLGSGLWRQSTACPEPAAGCPRAPPRPQPRWCTTRSRSTSKSSSAWSAPRTGRTDGPRSGSRRRRTIPAADRRRLPWKREQPSRSWQAATGPFGLWRKCWRVRTARLALLPSGTGNLLARNLKLTLDDPEHSIHTAYSGIDRPSRHRSHRGRPSRRRDRQLCVPGDGRSRT